MERRYLTPFCPSSAAAAADGRGRVFLVHDLRALIYGRAFKRLEDKSTSKVCNGMYWNGRQLDIELSRNMAAVPGWS